MENGSLPHGGVSGAIDGISAGRGARFAILALVAGALAIAFAPIFVRLSELGPSATAFYRVFLAVPVLAVAWWGEGRTGSRERRPSSLADYLFIGLAGFFFAGDLAFWHWSIRMTSVANATLLPNFAPIFVTLGAVFIFGERFSRLFLAGGAFAIIGACVLLGDSITLSPQNFYGDLLGLVTAVFYAAYILTIGRLRARFSTVSVMCWSSAATAICLLPVAILSGESLVVVSLYGLAILCGLAVISHAGGQGLIAFALAHLPAAFSSVGLLVQPVAAAGLAWILFDESVGGWQAIGAAVILAGILIARFGSR